MLVTRKTLSNRWSAPRCEVSGDGLLFGPTKLIYGGDCSFVDNKMEWFDPSHSGPEVKFDEWHHVLLSWDIQGSNSAHALVYDPATGPAPSTPLHEFFTARSKMYCAFDDENLTKNDLPSSFWIEGFGDNEITCGSCVNIAGFPVSNPPPTPDFSPLYGLAVHTQSYLPTAFRWMRSPFQPSQTTSGGRAYTPDSGTVDIDEIKKIEVAELQIFSGLLLDTNDVQ